ncbi:hypothetical protein H8B06_19230 [Sphingobacterium sp. DN00404]|uniref:Uncharacterized protein n=1 Tax=Sphingobacterium micropteri TaxID=2763501 RepID=A0ABR7YUD4_9SPHI|nr:hypothetical protein [Sphingobacterium micropteri]MBD1434962.1 hypothetical protein [Sphingobacterium micropteri]
MNSMTLKKGCAIIIILCTLLILSFYWIVLEAFGTKIRTVEIDKPLGKLICRERYDADLAAIFYDIDFKLVTHNGDTLCLGSALYHENDWADHIQLIKIEDTYCISAHDATYAKICLADKCHKANVSFTFSSLDLGNDTLWRKSNEEIPAWVYPGSSVIDSISSNLIYVKYAYRLGLSEPFSYKKQRLVYRLDTKTNTLITDRVYPATDNSM